MVNSARDCRPLISNGCVGWDRLDRFMFQESAAVLERGEKIQGGK
jgi:hypothetical protein